MTRGVLWDLDGTLADSGEYHWQAWRDTLATAGISSTHDQFLASFGQRNDSILGGWLGPDAGPERIRQIGDAKEAEYRRLVERGGLSPLPGAAGAVPKRTAVPSVTAVVTPSTRQSGDKSRVTVYAQFESWATIRRLPQ